MGVYTSIIEHVGCISTHWSALAIQALNSEVVDFAVLFQRHRRIV